jgi:holo-[acyl-carrier protein] synthase
VAVAGGNAENGEVIVGTGIDVVDVDRFAATLARTPGLRDRLFTVDERDRPLNSLAARFAAKEALAKALGAPAGLHWHDCWVVNDEAGRPHFELTGTVAACAAELGVTTIHLSLSHDAGIASAMVVAQR